MIKTRRTTRAFSPEFKLEAIKQVVKYQRDVREVALALELNPDHLRKWIRLCSKRKLTAVCSHQTRIGNLDAHLI